MTGNTREIRNLYRADIDGLRAIAVLSVMIYHLNAQWLPGGFVGVDIFFVISGFVVTGALAASQATHALAFIGEFYARRLARIMPALVLMLCTTALLATVFIPQAWLSGLSERTALFAFAGLSNWTMQQNDDTYFAPRAEFNPYTHTWSLGVEEQFYLIVPLIIFLWLLGRRAAHAERRHWWFIGLLFLLCTASFLGCLYATETNPTAAFYFLGFRFWELGLGALLYLVTLERATLAPALARALQGPLPWLGALLIGLACLFAQADRFPWPWALPAVLGSLLVIGGVRADLKTPVRRWLAVAPLLWIGKRSYSLYLWHWPLYVLLRWTLGLHTLPLQFAAVAGTFALATLSYRYVETPLRHHRRMEQWPPLARIAFFVVLTVLGWWAVQHLFAHPSRYSLSTVSRHPGDWYSGDHMSNTNPAERVCAVKLEHHPIGGGLEFRYVPHQCRDRSPSGMAHVLGDSHAVAYLPMFEQFSAETGRTVSVYTFAGCAFIDFRRPLSVDRPAGCNDFNRAIVQRVRETANAGDILFLPSLRIDRFGDQWTSFDHDVFQTMYSPAALKPREDALEDAKEWLRPFVDQQLRIVFEAPKPIFRAPAFRCSDWFNRHNPICVGNNRQPREELERLRAPIVASMRELARIFPSISVWDPFPFLCPGEVCSTSKDGRPLFFDGDHPSAYGNALLYPDFKAHLDARSANP
ncbi:acyltransferase family protein [Thiocystis violascens]|uniref:Putative acyltransferase n=1 Tax=Thiocystis violascens (strain ATCC 17096 / DSM 198 / 6111) TaxID=765911 RepID=I3YC84_THIV6|nr:acyltransferase family protein [Thiocystis violascens]AFL74602.1 putative acyltransferase [Thiocystis violascens DSM 198]